VVEKEGIGLQTAGVVQRGRAAEAAVVLGCFIIRSATNGIDLRASDAHEAELLFKWGSGTGTNFRRCGKPGNVEGGGGIASGPVELHEGLRFCALRRRPRDSKERRGKTRRAAKMVILNIDHPDIVSSLKATEGRAQGARADRAGVRKLDRRRSVTLRSSSRTPTTRCA